MNRPLIVAILLLAAAPAYAQQQPNAAKLKADAKNVVTSIAADKAKMRAYCEVTDLGERLVEATEEKDEKKADALMERTDQLEKILGPEYRALFDALYEAAQIQEMFRTFSRCSLCSISPVRDNNDPPPAALLLFATGLDGLGLLGWRRKRKAQAVA